MVINLQNRFVDRDIFMRYNHFGIGHPAMLRRIVRDSSGFESPSDINDEENSDGEHEEFGDDDGDEDNNDNTDDEVSDVEFSGEEQEQEDEGNGGWEGNVDEDEDNDDILYF